MLIKITTIHSLITQIETLMSPIARRPLIKMLKSEAPPASAIAPSIMSYSQDLMHHWRSVAPFKGKSLAFQGVKLSQMKIVKDLKAI